MNNFYEIPGYPRFKISEDGVVYDCAEEKVLQTRYNSKELPHVNVKYSNEFKRVWVVPMYALAFIEKPQDVDESKLIAVFKDKNNRTFSKDSVIWTTNSQHQTEQFKKRIQERRTFFNLPDFSKDSTLGFYPNPIECSNKSGYYHIPTTLEPVVINEDGKVYDLYRRQHKSLIITRKGYVNVALLGLDYNSSNQAVHRIVALLFKEIPERHKNKNTALLQVNHIDGVKGHNYPSNLEWVDGFENMNHARDNGLFPNQYEVLARNYITGEELKFRSISKLAEWFRMDINGVCKHLNSPSCGRLLYDGYQIKRSDDKPWQEPFDLLSRDDKYKYSGHIFVRDVQTTKLTVFNNLTLACEYFGMNPNIIKNHRCRQGKRVPYRNLVFLTDKEFHHGDL